LANIDISPLPIWHYIVSKPLC